MGSTLACLALAISSASRTAAGSTYDPCTCLKWSEVYAGRVACGEFAEFRNQVRPRVNLSLQEIVGLSQGPLHGYYEEKCVHWLPYMDDNYCLNVDNHAYSGWMPNTTAFEVASWCYVSDQCTELNGGQAIADKISNAGEVVHRYVSAKLCTPGRDRSLREFSVEELAAKVRHWRRLNQAGMFSLGLVSLEAYKALSPEHASWRAIEPILATGILDLLPPLLYNATRENYPVVVYTNPSLHSHYKVLQGRQLFNLEEIEETRLWGFWRTGRHACPDTVHCLEREAEL